MWGFQSESKMTTVSAVAKLIPRPPARVERRKQNCGAPGAEKERKREKLEREREYTYKKTAKCNKCLSKKIALKRCF